MAVDRQRQADAAGLWFDVELHRGVVPVRARASRARSGSPTRSGSLGCRPAIAGVPGERQVVAQVERVVVDVLKIEQAGSTSNVTLELVAATMDLRGRGVDPAVGESVRSGPGVCE